MSFRPVAIIAGLGAGSGTGAAVARLFANNGYDIALVARGGSTLAKLTDEINSSGGKGKATSFPINAYSSTDIASAFSSIQSAFPSPTHSIRVAVFNAGQGVWKPFLEVTAADLQATTQINVEGAFAFSRGAILAFKKNSIDSNGARGTLIFTGATASLRGNVLTSAFASGKFALRALSQSLSKEFGKENIHVSHAIIDGVILSGKAVDDRQLDTRLSPEGIAKAYAYLADQDKSTWTWELDLRPAHEKW